MSGGGGEVPSERGKRDRDENGANPKGNPGVERDAAQQVQEGVLFELLPSSSGSDDDDDLVLSASGEEMVEGSQAALFLQSQSQDGATATGGAEAPPVLAPSSPLHLKKYNSVDVHRIFQSHWKQCDALEADFEKVNPVDLQPVTRQRYCQLVNVDNWSRNPSVGDHRKSGDARVEDVLIPVQLLDPATLPSALLLGGGPNDDDEDDDEEVPSLSLGIPTLKSRAGPGGTGPIPPSGEFSLRPHQIDGIRFLWKRLAHLPTEDVPATGCILAHSMGLGKTAQTLVFLHLFYKHVAPKATTLLVLPKSVVSAWSSEYKKWSRYFPQDPLPLFEVLNVSGTKVTQRFARLHSWLKTGGVMVAGYESINSLYKAVQKQREERTLDSKFDQTLFTPRVAIDLIICDEGHRLKNDGLQVGSALKALHPKRRLVITGTPLQNHLMEYWSMVEFILPRYFTKRSFRNYFIQPIKESMHRDARPDVVQLAKKRTFTLIQELNFYVHRRDNEVLRRELPPLHEFVCVVPLTPIQAQLYEKFLKVFRQQAKKSLLQAFSYAAKICAHPELLYDAEPPKAAEEDDASDDEVSIITQQQAVQGTAAGAGGDPFKALHVRPEGYEPMSDDSAKLSVALQLIMMAKALGESCLVFSISTKLLDLFEICLQQAGLQHHQDADHLSFIRLDGSTSGPKREELINRFQSGKENIDVFLLSMKAGGLGVTLTAATRVIILDCAWNPAEDRQAVGRAYRYGQTKPVYIYRLVCNNTIEHRVFDQKVGKEWLFRTVVDTDTMKRDTLKGPKLQEVFCMTDPFCAQPLRRDWTENCCAKDALIKAVWDQDPENDAQRLLLGAMLHDSLLEEDPVKYGDEEERAYKDFVKRGGLWLANAEDQSQFGAAQRARFSEEAKEMKIQSRSLLATLGKIIEAKQRAAATGEGGGGRTSSLLDRINKVNQAGGVVPAGAHNPTINVDDRFMAPADRQELAPRGKVLMVRRRVEGLGSTKDIPLSISDSDDEKDATPTPAPTSKSTSNLRATFLAKLKGGAPAQPTVGDDEDDPMVIE